MIDLPILRRLDVDNYGLYLGTRADPGLHVDFDRGLTLVLGANGLGKTTLVTMLFRMLTGPYDIPSLALGGELGDRRLDIKPLQLRDQGTFAARVLDRGVDARAILRFDLGNGKLEVCRSLESLRILSLNINGTATEATEAAFHAAVLKNSRMATYSDWILALRHLTFYFEERRALVWDQSAQKQLLRLLFLPPDEASEWLRREREILELDSGYRNLQFTVGREERTVARTERAIGSVDEIRQQLSLLQRVQTDEQERLVVLNDDLVEITADRQAARVDALTEPFRVTACSGT